MKSRPVIIIFFLALVSNVVVHTINLSYLLEANPASLRQGVSVITQDDPSYLVPVENYLLGNGWQSNAVGDAAYVTRTPGYSLIYLGFRFWLPQKAALIGLLSFQFLLFAFSASLVFGIVRQFSVNEFVAFWLAMAFAIMPMFSGFLSYTLTEGVTPALVILFMYLVLASSLGSQKYYWWSAVVLAMIIIIRPPLIVLLAVYPLQMIFDGWKLNWKPTALALSISLIPMIAWQIYGFNKTEEMPGLHAIYHDDANDLYRPVHQTLWDFHKSWGQEGAEFHNDVNGIWEAALNNEPPQKAIESFVRHLPEGVKETIGEEKLKWTYQSYYQVLKNQKPFFESGKFMDGQTEMERMLGDSIRLFTKAYRSGHWFNAWVAVPSKVYWNMAAHSNLSLFVFQKPWRGNLFMEAMRWLSFLIHFGVFVLFPITFFGKLRNKAMLMFGLPIAMYLAYLCFVQRGVEERYTLPFLMPMLILVFASAIEIINQTRTKNE